MHNNLLFHRRAAACRRSFIRLRKYGGSKPPPYEYGCELFVKLKFDIREIVTGHNQDA
jgi:hypothetical protein